MFIGWLFSIISLGCFLGKFIVFGFKFRRGKLFGRCFLNIILVFSRLFKIKVDDLLIKVCWLNCLVFFGELFVVVIFFIIDLVLF